MYCSNCGKEMNSNAKFCPSCGVSQTVQNNDEVKIEKKPENLNIKSNKKFKKTGLIIIIILLIFIPLYLFYNNILNNLRKNIENNNDNKVNHTENNNEDNKDDNNDNNLVKGQYSREIFSKKSFDYKTTFENAVFTFNSDSTFECAYIGGNTYKGEYEVYNGLYISLKANEIAEDSSINNSEALAENIKKVSNNMMSSPEFIINTYLLYLKVNKSIENGITSDIDILQPFLIKYEPTTNSGVAVNIFGQSQGSFILR